MFTQAGFRQPDAFLCSAEVSRIDRPLPQGKAVVAYLCRWDSGDLAWASSTQICWPEQVRVHRVLHGELPEELKQACQ